MSFSFDPFDCHKAIMDSINPEMKFKGKDFQSWRNAWKPELEKLLGLDKMMAQPRPELNVVSLWKREHPLGVIEKIVFKTEPYSDATAYLCIPKEPVRSPMPFFVCLQGHSTGMHVSIAVDIEDETKSIEVDGDRDFGLAAMRYGVAALCIEQRGFGEREQPYKRNRCHNPVMHAIMLGRTLLGERIYDVDRAIDYLMTRNDVDKSAVGVMGNSGGGTVSMFAGGLLGRITHVMPSCSFSTFRDSIMAMEHCCCNYVPNLMLYAEMADVVGLAAPKPMVMVNGKDDPIFPISGAKNEFARLQAMYAAAGAENNCRHVTGDGGHRFYAEAAWPEMLKFLE